MEKSIPMIGLRCPHSVADFLMPEAQQPIEDIILITYMYVLFYFLKDLVEL